MGVEKKTGGLDGWTKKITAKHVGSRSTSFSTPLAHFLDPSLLHYIIEYSIGFNPMVIPLKANMEPMCTFQVKENDYVQS